MSGKTSLRRRIADNRLERALNAVDASRKERVAARLMFGKLVSGNPRVGFNSAETQVITALQKGRRERDVSRADTSAGQA